MSNRQELILVILVVVFIAVGMASAMFLSGLIS